MKYRVRNVLEYLEYNALNWPDKVSVSDKNKHYTYKELQSAAKQIGASLKKYELQNQPIGVMAKESITTIAYFLGVLYSGNYYVPIDPELPDNKKQTIIADSGMRVICSDPDILPLLYDLHYSGHIFSTEDIAGSECTIPVVGDNDPLFVVYTSGSTGVPKGVIKSHAAEIDFIEAYVKTFDFSSDEVIGNQTPFFFDASSKDIYLMLKLGCTMEILPSTLFSLPPELIDYLNERKVTFASWVPTVLSLVAQLNPFSMVKPVTLRKVFFVGEIMPVKHLNKWREALPDIEYVNLYGQSELAGICCYYIVNGVLNNEDMLPMGKPLCNCKVYLMDGECVVKEANHFGEVYIVSDALALGYYNDLQKTQSVFMIKDFGAGNERCFKTGDLAQYDENGNLIFASRNDNQIKHMGHRIELGEIETIAGAQPEIARCCCLYNNEKKKIVLFCQLSEDTFLTGRDIRRILWDKMSSYMVPGKVVLLEELPYNRNGKIDRQKLKSMI